MIHYDAQTLEEQIAVNKAIMAFLEGAYDNLEDAAKHLGITPLEVWDKNLSEAELPPCIPPTTIDLPTREPLEEDVYMSTLDATPYQLRKAAVVCMDRAEKASGKEKAELLGEAAKLIKLAEFLEDKKVRCLSDLQTRH